MRKDSLLLKIKITVTTAQQNICQELWEGGDVKQGDAGGAEAKTQ